MNVKNYGKSYTPEDFMKGHRQQHPEYFGKNYTPKRRTSRLDRLDQAGINPTADPKQLKRPTCNCGEAAALSIAQSHGEDVTS
jgi:hypothetical protein